MHCTSALAIKERTIFRKSNIKGNSLVVVFWTQHFQLSLHWVWGSISGQGTKISQNAWHGQKKEREKERKKSNIEDIITLIEALAKFTQQALTTVIRLSV